MAESESEARKADGEVPYEDVDRQESSSIQKGAKEAGITTMVIVMVLFIRIMAVSGWNWETAAELADAFNFNDAVPIFFGTLFELPTLTGIAAGVILPLALYRLYLIHVRRDHSALAADWVVVMILAIILFVLHHTYGIWWPILLAVIWGGLITAFVFLVHKGEALELLDGLSRRTGTLLVISFLILSIVVTTPWNPREEIGLKDGSVLEGHVIDTAPGFVKVLDSDRKVRVLLTGDIVSRKPVEIDASGEED